MQPNKTVAIFLKIVKSKVSIPYMRMRYYQSYGLVESIDSSRSNSLRALADFSPRSCRGGRVRVFPNGTERSHRSAPTRLGTLGQLFRTRPRWEKITTDTSRGRAKPSTSERENVPGCRHARFYPTVFISFTSLGATAVAPFFDTADSIEFHLSSTLYH